MKDNLELFSDHDLINELISRFDHVGFVGIKIKSGGPNSHLIRHQYKGDPFYVCGLCQHFINLILRVIRNNFELPGEEDASTT